MGSSQLIKLNTEKRVVDGLLSLFSAKTPAHLLHKNPKKNGTEIDLSSIFKILTNIRMEDGWTVEYDYHYGGIGGEPIVYALGQTGEKENIISHMIADDSPAGWFQIALFNYIGNQFYRYWHAGYNDIDPVVSSTDIEKLPSTVRSSLSEDIVCPSVEITEEGTITVNICLFLEHGGGVFKTSVEMNRQFPHQLREKESINIVPYQADYVF